MTALASRDGEHFNAYEVGLCYASVCTSLDDDTATSRLNWERPTGAHPWRIADDATFAGGEANPFPCGHLPGCRHMLFSC